MVGHLKHSPFNPEKLTFFRSERFKEPLSQLDFFQFVAEVASDQIYLMHSDSQILYANQAACDHLGYSPDELIGKYVWEWDPNILESEWPGMFQATVEKKHVHFETVHQTRAGKCIPVEIHSYYYTRDNEEFAVCIGKALNESQ